MNRSVQFIMSSCKKASALADKRNIMGLNWKENIELRVHLSICKGCTRYAKQSKLIDGFLTGFINEKETEVADIELSALQNKILSALKKQ